MSSWQCGQPVQAPWGPDIGKRRGDWYYSISALTRRAPWHWPFRVGKPQGKITHKEIRAIRLRMLQGGEVFVGWKVKWSNYGMAARGDYHVWILVPSILSVKMMSRDIEDRVCDLLWAQPVATASLKTHLSKQQCRSILRWARLCVIVEKSDERREIDQVCLRVSARTTLPKQTLSISA